MIQKFNQLLETVKTNNPNANLDLITKAFEFASEAHKDQKRISGYPYIMHPIEVAQTVA